MAVGLCCCSTFLLFCQEDASGPGVPSATACVLANKANNSPRMQQQNNSRTAGDQYEQQVRGALMIHRTTLSKQASRRGNAGHIAAALMLTGVGCFKNVDIP